MVAATLKTIDTFSTKILNSFELIPKCSKVISPEIGTIFLKQSGSEFRSESKTWHSMSSFKRCCEFLLFRERISINIVEIREQLDNSLKSKTLPKNPVAPVINIHFLSKKFSINDDIEAKKRFDFLKNSKKEKIK